MTLSDVGGPLAFLRRVSLFSPLNEPELLKIAARLERISLGAGDMLFQKGDPGNKLFMVVSGVVRISMASPDGAEMIVNLIKAGQVFGEIAALDGRPRTADARAEEDALLLALDRIHLMEFLRQSPDACLRILATACERLRWMNDLVEDVAFKGFHSRLAKRLLLLGQMFGQPWMRGGVVISLRLSQGELASHVGVTRESINKLLRSWRADGLVGRDGNRLVLLDPGRMALIADPLIER